MFKPVIILSVLAVFFICESSCQRFIQPTWRPPPQPRYPILQRARRGADDQPLWLYQGDVPKAPSTGDHPFLPQYIDDIKLDPHTRVARSYGTKSVSRGSNSRPSSSRDTGPTHPGYNRRNARAIPVQPIWPTLPPFNPRLPDPRRPWDSNPRPVPIYV
ncbi:lebocin-4-like [Anticarsia gemmatalis]|uniref:lebocin-4-like n=1 Tax=Anticarsia gemmatalis TaxID=129554 RepID=UPI003F75BA59